VARYSSKSTPNRAATSAFVHPEVAHDLLDHVLADPVVMVQEVAAGHGDPVRVQRLVVGGQLLLVLEEPVLDLADPGDPQPTMSEAGMTV
jgi:hypothetical protein